MRSIFRNTPSYLHFDRSRYEWLPDINYPTHAEKYKGGNKYDKQNNDAV